LASLPPNGLTATELVIHASMILAWGSSSTLSPASNVHVHVVSIICGAPASALRS
jgi:hypothetical protein